MSVQRLEARRRRERVSGSLTENKYIPTSRVVVSQPSEPRVLSRVVEWLALWTTIEYRIGQRTPTRRDQRVQFAV